MNKLVDAVFNDSKLNKIKEEKILLIDLMEEIIRSGLPVNCTYAEIISKARNIDSTYRLSFKMSRYDFKLFCEATISTLQDKQLRQFNLI